MDENSLLKTVEQPLAIGNDDDGLTASQQYEQLEAELAKGAAANDAVEKPENDTTEKPAKQRDEKGKFAKAQPEKPPEEKNEGAVQPKERVAFRQEMREARAKLQVREQQLAEREQQIQARLAQAESGSANHIRELAEKGDLDGVAKSMGYESWNKLNDHAARMFASPEYKRIRALEQQVAEQRAADEKIRAERAQAEFAAQQSARAQQAQTEIQEALDGSEDPVVVALAKDEKFGLAVFAQMEHIYKTTGDIPEIDEAAQEVVEFARKNYSHLHGVFGGQPTSQVEARSSASPSRAGVKQPERKQTKHVSTQRATEAAPPAPAGFTSDEEFRRIAVQEMLEAVRREREEEMAKAG